MGFGLWVQERSAGDVEIVLSSTEPNKNLFSLLADINRQLKASGAAVGIDMLNRVLVLSGGR
jgi:hypothetical protein